MNWILLPGLDGTGKLFEPLLDVIPRGVEPAVVSYLPDQSLGYDQLLPFVERHLPKTEPFILIAESFSGPIAIRIASHNPENLKAVVLCATFIYKPVPPIQAAIAKRINLPLPQWAARQFLLGEDAPKPLVARFYEAVNSVNSEVIFTRVKAVIDVGVRKEFAEIRTPILYLQAARDRLVGKDCAQLMLTIQKNMRIAVIDAPHFILQRNPKAAVLSIQKFLRDKHVVEKE